MKRLLQYIIFPVTIICAVVINGFGQPENIRVHDPCIIKADSTYYIFCTGYGITEWISKDLRHWHREKPVFPHAPAWTTKAVPGFRNFMWAPDISYYHGQYYLFYVVSAFAKNTSCIGLATNNTLDINRPDYHWVDRGKIIQSVPGRDMWNAIDPNLVIDNNGTPWLAFGSFWGGIKLVKLRKDRMSIVAPERWYTIAGRKRTFGIPDSLPGDAAIEAPYIFHHGKYFYLFVSFDYCCRGIHSNYKIMVGRSEKIMGPYADKNGTPMIKGGASLVLSGDDHWPGVGSNAVLVNNKKDYLVFHAYDATDHGKSRLRILPLIWSKDGWPEAATTDKAIKIRPL